VAADMNVRQGAYDAIREAEVLVEQMGATPGARYLATKLRALKEAVGAWMEREPSDGEHRDVLRQIEGVTAVARSRAPTVRRHV
jgi:hypothetical protein